MTGGERREGERDDGGGRRGERDDGGEVKTGRMRNDEGELDDEESETTTGESVSMAEDGEKNETTGEIVNTEKDEYEGWSDNEAEYER